jgi:hypothetical protein
MVIFNSYVKLPEGSSGYFQVFHLFAIRFSSPGHPRAAVHGPRQGQALFLAARELDTLFTHQGLKPGGEGVQVLGSWVKSHESIGIWHDLAMKYRDFFWVFMGYMGYYGI